MIHFFSKKKEYTHIISQQINFVCKVDPRINYYRATTYKARIINKICKMMQELVKVYIEKKMYLFI
jgi:hypothetical protein